MAKKNDTLRFAFGSALNPGSGVWRMIVTKNGDTYLNMSPEQSNWLHISIHASGKVHFKLGDEGYKKKIKPRKVSDTLFVGLVIFFPLTSTSHPPIPATGKIEKISWLGWPKSDQLVEVRLMYSTSDNKTPISMDFERIGECYKAKLFDEDMDLEVFYSIREMSDDEKDQLKNKKSETFPIKGAIPPEGINMIRVSNFEDGPMAIIHEDIDVEYKIPKEE